MKKIKMEILANLLVVLFKLQSLVIKIRAVNYPKGEQFILGLWHAHQCGIYGVKDRHKLHALISQSNDGEMIARATEAVGIKTVRGSQKRKGASATLKLIEMLEQGENIAITVDGPRGPNRVVKKGIINIAKLSQVPIIPMVWNSNSKLFLKFPSWDGFRYPLFNIDTITLYGEPIYVPADANDEQIEQLRKQLENDMRNLENQLENNYEDYSKIAVNSLR